jgi:hypothetical protein
MNNYDCVVPGVEENDTASWVSLQLGGASLLDPAIAVN